MDSGRRGLIVLDVNDGDQTFDVLSVSVVTTGNFSKLIIKCKLDNI